MPIFLLKAIEKQAEKAQEPQAGEEKADASGDDTIEPKQQVIPILKRKRKGEA